MKQIDYAFKGEHYIIRKNVGNLKKREEVVSLEDGCIVTCAKATECNEDKIQQGAKGYVLTTYYLARKE